MLPPFSSPICVGITCSFVDHVNGPDVHWLVFTHSYASRCEHSLTVKYCECDVVISYRRGRSLRFVAQEGSSEGHPFVHPVYISPSTRVNRFMLTSPIPKPFIMSSSHTHIRYLIYTDTEQGERNNERSNPMYMVMVYTHIANVAHVVTSACTS